MLLRKYLIIKRGHINQITDSLLLVIIQIYASQLFYCSIIIYERHMLCPFLYIIYERHMLCPFLFTEYSMIPNHQKRKATLLLPQLVAYSYLFAYSFTISDYKAVYIEQTSFYSSNHGREPEGRRMFYYPLNALYFINID